MSELTKILCAIQLQKLVESCTLTASLMHSLNDLWLSGKYSLMSGSQFIISQLSLIKFTYFNLLGSPFKQVGISRVVRQDK